MTVDKESGSVPPLLVKYPQAAAMLSLSEKAVQKLVANGELKVIRPSLFSTSGSANRTVLIPVSELHAWISRQLADSEQEPGAA